MILIIKIFFNYKVEGVIMYKKSVFMMVLVSFCNIAGSQQGLSQYFLYPGMSYPEADLRVEKNLNGRLEDIAKCFERNANLLNFISDYNGENQNLECKYDLITMNDQVQEESLQVSISGKHFYSAPIFKKEKPKYANIWKITHMKCFSDGSHVQFVLTDGTVLNPDSRLLNPDKRRLLPIIPSSLLATGAFGLSYYYSPAFRSFLSPAVEFVNPYLARAIFAMPNGLSASAKTALASVSQYATGAASKVSTHLGAFSELSGSQQAALVGGAAAVTGLGLWGANRFRKGNK